MPTILRTIISSLFIVLFFFLIKTKINLKTAFFSSVLISFLSYFASNSSQINILMLISIFFISSFYFLDIKKRNFLFLGILSGLAHLTHPIGILLPITVICYLVFKKQYRGSIIFITTYVLLLIPWFIRNFFVLHDIGGGLYIPFSN